MPSRSGVELFWTPPRPGERILGMTTYQDVVVVATTDGVYTIAPHGRILDDLEVRQVSHDTIRSIRDEQR